MSSKTKSQIEEELNKKKKLYSNKTLMSNVPKFQKKKIKFLIFISQLPDKGEKIKNQIESLEGLLKLEEIQIKQKEENKIDYTIDYLKQLKIEKDPNIELEEEKEKRKREKFEDEIFDKEVEELMKKMKKTSISKEEKLKYKEVISLSHEESIKYAKLNKEKMMKSYTTINEQKFEEEEESKPISSLIEEEEIFE